MFMSGDRLDLGGERENDANVVEVNASCQSAMCRSWDGRQMENERKRKTGGSKKRELGSI